MFNIVSINMASILVLVLLAVTFIQSGYDKVMDWKGNIEWLKEHFANTSLRNRVPLALLHILVLELISGILCIVGVIQLFLYFALTLDERVHRVIIQRLGEPGVNLFVFF